MDKREYDLVLKITKNSIDSNSLFYRISALLAKGDAEAALNTIEINQKTLEADLFVLAKIHIEILCLMNRFDDARDALKHYEELPYMNQEVEELLRSLPEYIRLEEKRALKGNNIDNDGVYKLLLSKDNNEVLMGLDLLKDKEINNFLLPISKILIDFPAQSIRSFALLTLIKKNVNHQFKFKSIDQIIVVNPSELTPPFVGEEFNTFIKKIDHYTNNPVLNRNATQLLSTYILYIYPSVITYSDDLVLAAIFYIAEQYLGNKDIDSIELYAKKKLVDEKELKELIDAINTAIENF